MKRGAFGHPKLKRLMKQLRVSHCHAVGILESLWHIGAEWRKDGDFGDWSAEDIAAAMQYDGNPDELIAALVEAGWLDRAENGSVRIHHWNEHCPDYIKRWLRANRPQEPVALPLLQGPGVFRKNPDATGEVQTTPEKNGLPAPAPEPAPCLASARPGIPIQEKPRSGTPARVEATAGPDCAHGETGPDRHCQEFDQDGVALDREQWIALKTCDIALALQLDDKPAAWAAQRRAIRAVAGRIADRDDRDELAGQVVGAALDTLEPKRNRSPPDRPCAVWQARVNKIFDKHGIEH